MPRHVHLHRDAYTCAHHPSTAFPSLRLASAPPSRAPLRTLAGDHIGPVVVIIAVIMVDVVVMMMVVPTALCVGLGLCRRQRARACAATARGVGGIAQIVEDQDRHAARREKHSDHELSATGDDVGIMLRGPGVMTRVYLPSGRRGGTSGATG